MTQLSDVFRNNVQKWPEKQAICCDGTNISYSQLADLVNRLVNGLKTHGVTHGESIGVLLPNSIEFVSLMLAAAECGAALVPLNLSLPLAAIRKAFLLADVRHVVSNSYVLTSLRQSEIHDFSFLTGLYLSVDDEISGFVSFQSMLDSSETGSIATTSAQDSDPFIFTMTSGSTGDPKPIVLTQRTKLNRALAAVELYGVTEMDRTLAATPLYHSLAERLVLIPLLTGGTSILMTRFSPVEWIRTVHEQNVTFTIAVSSQLKSIGEELASHGKKISSLRCVVSSSALIELETKAKLIERLNCDFHECYGTSEIAIATNLDPTSANKKLQSVGIAAPGVELKILSENNTICEPGEIGEIICKTPMIFVGYYKSPQQTSDAMFGEYFRTGDLGSLDENGFLYFKGRTKDLIISGGINIYPQDIESSLSDHPMINECIAFAYPDERLGEVVAVAIVPSERDEFSLRKIRHQCAKKLADFQQPRMYFIVDELPLNEMGKISRLALPEKLDKNYIFSI